MNTSNSSLPLKSCYLNELKLKPIKTIIKKAIHPKVNKKLILTALVNKSEVPLKLTSLSKQTTVTANCHTAWMWLTCSPNKSITDIVYCSVGHGGSTRFLHLTASQQTLSTSTKPPHPYCFTSHKTTKLYTLFIMITCSVFKVFTVKL